MTRTEILRTVSPMPGLVLPPSATLRCAAGARLRGESIAATAVPYRRYLLLEVSGPWGRTALDERHLGPQAAASLSRAMADASLNVLLIRRSGRQRPVADDARAWALADTETERVRWGTWSKPAELLEIDLTAPVSPRGPQRLALICTNGKRDQCCAISGRPVAEALTTVPGWDTWECTHLGGHRFAATALLLPTGDMFGWLDRRSAELAVERFDAGEFLLPHYRGRSGQPLPVQAALHAAALGLGDPRRQAFRLVRTRRLDGDGRWEVLVSHRTAPGTEILYQVVVGPAPAQPAVLSCTDESPQVETRSSMLALRRAGR